jgi:Fe-S cluster assembly protein SufD
MADRLTNAERIREVTPHGTDGVDAGALLDRASASAETERFREFWKYTPAAEFIDGLKSCPVSKPEITGLDQPGISVMNLPDLSAGLAGVQDQPSTERFPLADLALMLAGDLIVIDVAETLQAPIQIQYAQGLATPILLRLAPGVQAKLVEQARTSGFLNHSLYVHIGADASLEHAFAATTSEHSHWAMAQVQQASRSQYRRQQYLTGAGRRRSETQILLNEPEASADITGAYVVEGGRHLDQQIILEHRSADTRSHQRFHGIGAGKGTSVFNGRIHIHPGAPRSDAGLSNRNLSLHPEAIINTKPELEIYTDDVRCSHGATVGQISEDSLFYLRSRGLTPADAKRMLCRAFINECIEGPLAQTAEQALLGDWTRSA